MSEAHLLDSTLESLAFLIGGADHRQRVVWPKARVEAFDGFEMFEPKLQGDEEILFTNPGDIPVWPMDACWGMPLNAETNENGLNGWGFKRVCTLDQKKWRGKIRRYFPRMVEHHELSVTPSGVSLGSFAPLGLLKNKVVLCANRTHPGAGITVDQKQMYETARPDAFTAFERFDVGFAHGVMLRREYLWSVLLGEPGIPRARFVTDILGVREAFRLRDIPAGASRRAALRHWVREHWRKRGRESEVDRAWVRSHLRGATDFTWSGLNCRIEPSREDLRRALGHQRGTSVEITPKPADNGASSSP